MADVPVGDYYAHVRLWTAMLRTFIGWSDSQVVRWAAWCKDAAQDENDWFYHDPPEFYVASLLTPHELKNTIGDDKYFALESEVEGVLRRALLDAKSIQEIDWQPAKEQIETLLAQYGESLASVANQNKHRYQD